MDVRITDPLVLSTIFMALQAQQNAAQHAAALLQQQLMPPGALPGAPSAEPVPPTGATASSTGDAPPAAAN